MIPASGLYGIPRCTSPSQTEELLRYARLEHGATNLEWAVAASASSLSRTLGVREWLASHLRLPRPAAVRASSASLRPGLASVHFNDETEGRTAKAHALAAADHPCELLAQSALILPVQPHQPASDETCTCEM